jgi:hypothetical protein
MLGGVLSLWRENWSGEGVPAALDFPILSRGPVIGALIGVERVVVGIFGIVVWRLFAKALFLRTLPPIFRGAARLFDFDLPTRAGYQPAT